MSKENPGQFRIEWYNWDENGFEAARKKDKPIFLYLYTTWGHYTHLFELNTLLIPEISDLIKKEFVPIRVDSQRNPEIFERYNQGGWPSVCMLTPTGELLHGSARPNYDYLISAMNQVADYYKKNKEEIYEKIKKAGSPEPIIFEYDDSFENINFEPLDYLRNDAKAFYDIKYSGFSKFPKYIYSELLEYLIDEDESELQDLATVTLKVMAESQICDHLGGGFFRFCEDEAWRRPHFEKMLFDNAILLNVYLEAYKATSQNIFKETADNILRFIEGPLGDQATGLFFNAQDSDGTPGDRTGFYCWSEADIKEKLEDNDKEAKAFILRYGIDPQAAMPDGSQRCALEKRTSISQVALQMDIELDEAEDLLNSAFSKIQRAYYSRKEPAVEDGIYTSGQGVIIRALSKASILLNSPRYLQRSFEIADLIWNECKLPNDCLKHEIGIENDIVYLVDQVEMIRGYLELYRTAGRANDLIRAEKLTDAALVYLGDENSPGCFDFSSDSEQFGSLNIKFMPFDSNSKLLQIFIELAHLTENKEWYQRALKLANALSKKSITYRLQNASYAAALKKIKDDTIKIDLITGEGAGILRKEILTLLPSSILIRSFDSDQITQWTPVSRYPSNGGQATAVVYINNDEVGKFSNIDEIIKALKF